MAADQTTAGTTADQEPLEMCECCAALVPSIMGAPCGAEVCPDCFNNGAA